MRHNSWYIRKFGWVPRPVRQTIVSVIGGTLLLLGLVGMALPIMPGFIFIPIALAILAVEFAWAARWLHQLKRTAKGVGNRVRNGFGGRGFQADRGTTGANMGCPPPVLRRPFWRRWFSSEPL